MTQSEIEVIGQALAFHPPVVIGALLVFQYIKRRIYYSHKAERAGVSSAIKL